MSVVTPPARMSITNLVTLDTLRVQYNPTEFEETIGAEWSKLKIPGLSHQRKHFSNTDDAGFAFTLFSSADTLGPSKTSALAKMRSDRTFLIAAAHPWRSQTIARGGPPRLLFVWPKLVSLTCVLTKLTFNYTRFNADGDPVQYTAKVMLEEIRDAQVSMEDILLHGTQRASLGGV